MKKYKIHFSEEKLMFYDDYDDDDAITMNSYLKTLIIQKKQTDDITEL